MTINKTVALAGQFDQMLASFIAWNNRKGDPNLRFLGLNNVSCADIPNILWRRGSLISARDTASMLGDIDTLLYFCLTPPPPVHTSQGYALDVALVAAANFAQSISKHPKCRVVLVTRYFPDDYQKLSTYYAFWRQIIRVFKSYCSNLAIIQTMPVISDKDVFMLGMLEHGHLSPKRLDSEDTEWLNLTSPVTETQLFEGILKAISEDTISSKILSGDTLMAYIDVKELISQSRKKLHTLKALKCSVEPESRSRARLLNETLRFHTTQIMGEEDRNDRRIREDIADIFERDISGTALLLKPKAGEKARTGGYAQRVISGPKRSVSEIADLLMQWLPRYFQRMVQVDEIASSRLLCRMARIPLLELEKREESPNRCRLLMRNPWAHTVQSKASLLVTTTEECDNPGELLVIIEDTPDSKLLTMTVRGLLLSFAKYLKEYGCGEAIPGKPGIG